MDRQTDTSTIAKAREALHAVACKNQKNIKWTFEIFSSLDFVAANIAWQLYLQPVCARYLVDLQCQS